MIRQPVFAHQGWYPADRALAEKQLDKYLQSEKEPSPALAVISPHAGWVFSGPTAGRLFAEVEIPDRVVLLCPTHRGFGPKVAVWAEGLWLTPLGDAEVDADFAGSLLSNCLICKEDYDSHRDEHAIEIQLPFILARNPKARIVPLQLGRLDYADIETLAASLVKTVQDSQGGTLMVASSDMSHESDYNLVKKNDQLARERVMDLDARGLVDTVEANRITMCGYIPAAIVIEAARRLGAAKAVEVAYTTSADVSGRHDYVVGYLAARFDE